MAFLRFSTYDYPSTERLEVLQDVYAANAQVNIILPQDENPRVTVLSHFLVGVTVACVESSTMTVTRGKTQIADGNDDIVLMLNPGNPSSHLLCYQHSNAHRANNIGLACIGTNNSQGKLTFIGHKTRLIGLMIPRQTLSSRVIHLDKRLKDGLILREPARLLLNQAFELIQPDLQLSPDKRLTESDNILDLVALSLGATPEASHKAINGGLSAARFRAIKTDLASHAGSCDLTLDWIAKRHGVSPRYVRALFERNHCSFTEYLLELRLQRAFNRLVAPENISRPIVDIAYASGFSSVSWFYRAFCRRFGYTPGDAQTEARKRCEAMARNSRLWR